MRGREEEHRVGDGGCGGKKYSGYRREDMMEGIGKLSVEKVGRRRSDVGCI